MLAGQRCELLALLLAPVTQVDLLLAPVSQVRMLQAPAARSGQQPWSLRLPQPPRRRVFLVRLPAAP